MLSKPGFGTRYALQRAADAAETAARSVSAEERQTWLAIERGWLRLAASYDLTDRIGAFIKDQDRKPRWPDGVSNTVGRVIQAHEEALRSE